MKLRVYRTFILVLLLMTSFVFAQAQTFSARLEKAYAKFERDPQLKYASHSIYVMEVATGKLVFAKNPKVGLAPASTMKVVTAAAAYSLLGADFTYETSLGVDSSGSLVIRTSGDPSFGSWRYAATQPDEIIKRIKDSFARKSIVIGSGEVKVLHQPGADKQKLPDGWIMQDIGNYYGAGAQLLNWKENQYDLLLKSTSRIGDPVEVVNRQALPSQVKEIENYIVSAAAGTGDNAYIYLPISGDRYMLKGTIPVNEGQFKISGSVPDGADWFLDALMPEISPRTSWKYEFADVNSTSFQPVARFQSPGIDSVSYWFLRRSINLYGEALLKTIGEKKGKSWSAESGLAVLRKFWSDKGIDSFALRMQDGSGLSPQNRITTEALVKVLQYARSQPWFPSYFEGFPVFNGIRMKSGTINGVKGFCGFHRSKKDGKEYVFAIIVNNHSGASSTLVKKIYEVLDEVK